MPAFPAALKLKETEIFWENNQVPDIIGLGYMPGYLQAKIRKKMSLYRHRLKLQKNILKHGTRAIKIR